MQLLPENGAHLLLLKEAVARALGGEQPELEHDRVGGWLESLDGGAQLPLPGLHCAELTVPTGGFRVFPDAYEDEHWVLKLLLGPGLRTRDLPKDLRAEIRALGEATLRISEAVAERAGIQRNTEPEHRPGEPAVIPDRTTLNRLISAVSFTREEMVEIAGADWATVLAPLSIDASAMADQSHGDRIARLRSRPLVMTEDRIVVAAPDALPLALRHRIVVAAKERGAAEGLLETFLTLVTWSVKESLSRLGFLVSRAAPPDPDPAFDRAEMLFLSDTDKELHLVVLADDLEDYDLEDPASPWKGGAAPDDLEDRLQAVALDRLCDPGPPHDILHLVVAQGLGRPIERIVAPAGELGDLRLVLSASELETIARCEEPDLYLPWSFARAAAALRERLPLAPVSQLEEWASWRRNGRSFSTLELIVAEQGGGGAILVGDARLMRIEVGLRDDPHAAETPSGEHVEVIDYLEDDRVPIAQLDAAPMGSAALIVECLPTPVWVLPATDISPEALPAYLQWTELIAYWLWQLGPSTEALWRALEPAGPVTIEVLLEESEARDAEPWTAYEKSAGAFVVRVGPDALETLSGEDNRGERVLMSGLLEVLIAAATRAAGAPPLDAHALAAAIEQHMSPPDKRKLVPIADVDPGYERPGFPQRNVSQAETSVLRAEVGYAAAMEAGLDGPGAVPPETAHAFLNSTVSILFRGLEQLTATLHPDGLLEWVISLNERLLHEDTLARSQLAVGRAAFGEDSPFARRSAGAAADAASAAVASRFLIEYLAARPPGGLRPMSYETYDHLLAAAALIVRLGMSSDLILERLADVEVAVFPTGEVFDIRGDFELGMGRFHEESLLSESARASTWMAEHLASDPQAEDDFELDLAEVDGAMREETGHSLSELIGALGRLGTNPGLAGGATALPRSEAIDQLAGEFDWDDAKCRSVIAHFSLGPRANFTIPPPGFERRDLWPWRFNRRLSYLRRPLIERPNPERPEDPTLVFGVRQLFNTALYIEMLISHGQMEAHSKAMQDYMSKMQRRESDLFRDEVANAYEAESRRVRAGFHKVGGKRLADKNGDDLGDVDVLVADLPSRTLLCVETKRFAGALAPHQLRNQIERTLSEQEDKRSYARRHLRRVEQVKQLLEDVLKEIGIEEDPTDWHVEYVMVTDIEMLAAFVTDPPLPVRSFDQIKASLVEGRLY